MSNLCKNTNTLETLLAKQDISEVLISYAIGIDRGDAEALGNVFWPDAECNYGTYSGPPGQFVAHVMKSIPLFNMTMHSITNIFIEIAGTHARSQAYFNAYHGFADAPPIFVGGRYLDRFENRDGQWRIAYRRFVLDWHAGAKSDEDFPVAASRRAKGGRKPDDLWYGSF
jgi:hypothetical protein